MASLEYAYLPAILLLLPVYLFLYFIRKDIQKKMLRFSLVGAIAGPVSQWWYLKDYWHPVYTLGGFGFLEDLLFAFFVCGITVGIANVFLNVESVPEKTLGDKGIRYIVALALMLGSLLVFTNVFGLNSIYASAVGFMLLALLIWHERPDLFKASLVGAVFWMVLAALAYTVVLSVWPTFISDWWDWKNISGVTFFYIPLEEFLWFGTWGLAGSVILEWKRGLRFVPRRV